MHELSVCAALIAQVEEIARSHNAAKVVTIHLDLGPLSGVEKALLRRAYPLAAADTVAEDSELVIGECGVRVRCLACGAETPARPNRLLCGECGDWRTQLTAGDELMLRSVELQTLGPDRAVA